MRSLGDRERLPWQRRIFGQRLEVCTKLDIAYKNSLISSLDPNELPGQERERESLASWSLTVSIHRKWLAMAIVHGVSFIPKLGLAAK